MTGLLLFCFCRASRQDRLRRCGLAHVPARSRTRGGPAAGFPPLRRPSALSRPALPLRSVPAVRRPAPGLVMVAGAGRALLAAAFLPRRACPPACRNTGRQWLPGPPPPDLCALPPVPYGLLAASDRARHCPGQLLSCAGSCLCRPPASLPPSASRALRANTPTTCEKNLFPGREIFLSRPLSFAEQGTADF